MSSNDTQTPTRRRRVGVIGAVALVVVVALGVGIWRYAAGAGDTVPYTDPQAAGLLTLCTADGEQVTEGKVTDHPFADYVLGETPVGSDYNPDGAVASVFAYQPRQGIEPSEFSGVTISSAFPFADPAQPATQVESGAWSIGDFVTAFPAEDDGYVQLRLYLGVDGVGTLTNEPYDTADLKVDGDSWHVVRGGDADCGHAADAVVQPAN